VGCRHAAAHRRIGVHRGLFRELIAFDRAYPRRAPDGDLHNSTASSWRGSLWDELVLLQAIVDATGAPREFEQTAILASYIASANALPIETKMMSCGPQTHSGQAIVWIFELINRDRESAPLSIWLYARAGW